jgi:hypothetical protein
VPDNLGGRKHQSSLASKISRAIAAYPHIVGSEPVSVMKDVQKQRSDDDLLATRISAKIEDGKMRGAIRLASSDDVFAPHDEAILTALRLKHLARSSSHFSAASSMDSSGTYCMLAVSEADIIAAIRSFPNGSAGGLDQLRPQCLKDD